MSRCCLRFWLIQCLSLSSFLSTISICYQILQTDPFCIVFIIEMSADHVGKEICVSTDDGKFYGTIHSVDGKHGKLILQKGIWLLFDFFEFEIHLSFRMQLPFDNFKSHTVFITSKVYTINKSHYAKIFQETTIRNSGSQRKKN